MDLTTEQLKKLVIWQTETRLCVLRKIYISKNLDKETATLKCKIQKIQ